MFLSPPNKTWRRAKSLALVAFALLLTFRLAHQKKAPSYDPASRFRTTDLTVDNFIVLGSGSADIIQFTGNPNASVGATKGSIVLDTSTPNLWENTTGSNVWTAIGGAVTPSLTIGQAVTTGTPNLTTLCTTDWMIPTDNTPKSGLPLQHGVKFNGGRLIEYPVWYGVFFNIAGNVRAQLVTWTATDLLSQGSAGAGFGTVLTGFNSTGVVGWGFETSAPSSVVSRTFVVYLGNFNETDGVTCTAHMVDNEIADASTSFTLAGSSDDRTLTTVFKSAQATRVNVSCVVTSNPAGANLGWLALCIL